MTTPEYRAGLFDGEGSITTLRQYTKASRTEAATLVPMLSMGNTDLRLLEEMQRAYTGHIVKNGKKPRHKQSYTWTLRSAPKVRTALADMYPHLIGKAERARVMFVLLTTYERTAGSNRIPLDMMNRRMVCQRRLRLLNVRGDDT